MDILPVYIISIFVFIFGTVWGSFLNVCIYRIPAGLSVVSPPSNCPNCHEDIKPYDNIPIFSYIILGGKCRSCKEPYSPRYAMVELMTGLITVALLFRYGLTVDFALLTIFIYALIVVSFIDIDHKIIPNGISLTGIPLGLIAAYFASYITLKDSLIGLALGFGALLSVALVYYLIFKKEGMGGGDVKLLAMIGAWLGFKGTLFTLFFSSIIGSIVGLIIMVAYGRDPKHSIPFGPFLSGAALIYVLVGEYIINWYIGLIV